MVSAPGVMDLGSILPPRRALKPVPDPEPEPETVTVTVPVEEQRDQPGAPDSAVEAPEQPSAPVVPSVQPDDRDENSVKKQQPIQPVAIEPVEEDHSGYVTLYLARELNKWLTEHHDSTGVSYPGIILNAISWAAADNRFAEIFAPDDSPIPANDIFGRAPAVSKLSRGQVDPEARPVRFRKDHMRVIIGLARTWTADNRNAFFVGILSAYRDRDQQQELQTDI